MTRVRTIALATGLTLAAGAPHALAESPPSEVAAEADARQALAACAMLPTRPATRVIYTWTSAEQIAALRKGGDLLTRSKSADGRRSHFDWSVDRYVERGPLREALDARTARRFGWHRPFATIAGTDTENYGDHLLRIELESDALIAVFRPGTDTPLSYVTVAGDPVAEADVDADRITAVYHEAVSAPWADTFGPAPSSVVPKYRYREFVVVSDVGVKAIGYGGDAELKQLRDDAALLARVSPAMPAEAPAEFSVQGWSSNVTTAWSDPTLDDDLANEWALCINLPLEAYTPFQNAIDERIADLEAAVSKQGKAFERKP